MEIYKNYVVEIDGSVDVGELIENIRMLGADVLRYEDKPDVLLVEGLPEDKIDMLIGISSYQEV